MAIAKGVAKTVAYKKETTWGTAAGSTGAKIIRRVSSAFNLGKETYQSNEIRVDRQIVDFRHGVRSATGSISGELSSATYAPFLGSLLGRDFSAVSPIVGLTLTVAVGSTPRYTITRSSGDFLAAGINAGMVIRISGSSIADHNGKNLLICSLTSTVLTVVVMNAKTLTAGSGGAACTISVSGKTSYVPLSSHTDQSYTIEEYYADINQSEVFTGMKVNSANISLPSTGLATIDLGFAGKDITYSATQYYTSPTSESSTGLFAAVNGIVVVEGRPIALITSADITIERPTENAVVVGSNTVADVFTGRFTVNGNLSVYFQDSTFRSYYDSETPVTIIFSMSASEADASDFMTFTMPKVKLGSFTTDDGEQGIIASTTFQALLNTAIGGGLEPTTIQIQDSAA